MKFFSHGYLGIIVPYRNSDHFLLDNKKMKYVQFIIPEGVYSSCYTWHTSVVYSQQNRDKCWRQDTVQYTDLLYYT